MNAEREERLIHGLEPLLTSGEAAELLGVSTRTLLSQREAWGISGKRIGKRVMFARRDIARVMKRGI